jgi:aminoglycoside phosphotransferase family enzyme
LARLANSLVAFYRDVPVAGLTGQDYVQLFEQEQAKNRAVLKEPRFARDLGSLDDLLARFDDTLAAVRGELEQRVRDGRIVDGHGDLRPEHVCLVDPPVVIDCLEFSERLRMIDPFDELVYLGLECAVIGAPAIRGDVIERCAAGLGDRPSVGVLRFYEAYRAFLRARQSLAHLLVPAPREPAKWMPKALGYIAVAERALLTR